MAKETPATHIRRINGAADLDGAEADNATMIALESSTGTVRFFARGATRTLADNYSDQTLAGNKTLSGTTTLATAALTNVTAAAFSGVTSGVRGATVVTNADTISPGAGDSGTMYVCTKSSATQVFTLPAAATAGLRYTFVCNHASGEIRVGVATGDAIIGKTHGAENGTGLISTTTTGLLLNTAATNVVGDFCTLQSDGVNSWFMTAVAGVWSVT